MDDIQIKVRVLEINGRLLEYEQQKVILMTKQQELNNLTNMLNMEFNKTKDDILENLKKEMDRTPDDQHQPYYALIQYVSKKNIYQL
jgi:phosphoenolpyruvate carboxylase